MFESIILTDKEIMKPRNIEADDKQRERLKEILENHCAVADCKAYGQDCTAEDCASCLADHILADGWIRPKLKEEAEQALKCDKTKEWLHSDIDDLIDMDYGD